MRTLLITAGSRGDIQPFVALARGLASAGHDAVVAGPRRFASVAADHDVPFAPLDDRWLDLQDELADKGARAAFTAARAAKSLLRPMFDDIAAAAERGADVVVYHPKTLVGPHVADKLGVPSVLASLIPLYLPTAEFPSPVFPVRLPRALNRASWRLAGAVETPFRGLVRAWRSESLGLPGRSPSLARRAADGPPLHAWSRHLLPAPADWPPGAAPTGFWSLPAPATWTPPDRLARFLKDGDPPVYVGFGSMVNRDPEDLTRTVLGAIRRTGRRAVLATGWGGLRPGDEPDGVLVLREAPHDWLLPRTALAVHHGGIGTVAAAMAAGVPQIVRPFLGDQTFWGWRVHGIGVGPAPLTGRLTPDRLAGAIDRAKSEPGYAERARAVAAKLSAEDGVAAAAAAIERLTQRVG
ncbi:MAG: glycosyltransferase [Streptosporangiales bacterium]|nr:glycosyltransferase [Streptosporangiales bacterium]